MANRPSLDDYVDVAERIQDFKDAHPEGSLQTLGWEVVTVEGVNPKTNKPEARTFIVYRAAAYRSADDATPGHGIAWEPWPGGTPYTKDSELMNAETAAWGRAIVALGLVANRKLASRQEVRNRVADQDAEAEAKPAPKAKAKAKAKPAKWQPSDEQITELREFYGKTGWPEQDKDHERLRMVIASVGANNAGDLAVCLAALTEDQFAGVRDALVEAAVSETFDATPEPS